jgi:hypothetical protein
LRCSTRRNLGAEDENDGPLYLFLSRAHARGSWSAKNMQVHVQEDDKDED